VPFISIFVIVLIFVLVSLDPPVILFGLFVLYGVSGYGALIWRLHKGKPVSIVQMDIDSLEDKNLP